MYQSRTLAKHKPVTSSIITHYLPGRVCVRGGSSWGLEKTAGEWDDVQEVSPWVLQRVIGRDGDGAPVPLPAP